MLALESLKDSSLALRSCDLPGRTAGHCALVELQRAPGWKRPLHSYLIPHHTRESWDKVIPKDCGLRRTKYLTNIVEQGHRFIRRGRLAMQVFHSFHTAERTLEGIEAMFMMRKGRVKGLNGRHTLGQAKFIVNLFGIAA